MKEGWVIIIGIVGLAAVALYSLSRTGSTSTSGFPAGTAQTEQAIVQANANALATQAAEASAGQQLIGGLASGALTAGTQLEAQSVAANTAIQEQQMNDQATLVAATASNATTMALANLAAQTSQANVAAQANAVTQVAAQQASTQQQAIHVQQQQGLWNSITSLVGTGLAAFGL